MNTGEPKSTNRKPDQEPSLQPLALSPDQAARLLNVGRTTIFSLIRDGKLRARKLGARTLIAHADLVRLLDDLAAVGVKSDTVTLLEEAIG